MSSKLRIESWRHIPGEYSCAAVAHLVHADGRTYGHGHAIGIELDKKLMSRLSESDRDDVREQADSMREAQERLSGGVS